MLKDIRLAIKLPIILIFFAFICAALTGTVTYFKTASAIKTEAQSKLFALLESRESSLLSYLANIQKDVIYHSQSPLTFESLSVFTKAWDGLGNNQKQYLQSEYITKNPFNVGLKSNLSVIADISSYAQIHAFYHPLFINLKATRSFDDIFLIDTKGNIVYTVTKEKDFASNLLNGPWADSGLGEIFNRINNAPSIGNILFSDFRKYAPSNNVPASFIASPVFDLNNNYLGVLAFQLPIEELNTVMQVTAGMGKTGETYLVGSDLLMRSDSRFYSHRNILEREIDTISVNYALQGKQGIHIISDYRGTSVFSAFKDIEFLGTKWAILAEVDEAEVLEPIDRLNRYLGISALIIAIAITLLGYLIAIDLSHPLQTMINVLSRLSKSDLSVNISVSERKDEVGKLAKAMVLFKKSALKQEELKLKLQRLAHYDSLTNLPNRDAAKNFIESLIDDYDQATSKGFCVIFADLDNFKLINDTYGHNAGDNLLIEVSSLFKHCLRENDLVARIGGDEFLFIIPEITSKEECSVIANKIISSINSSFGASASSFNTGVSLGLAIYPQDGQDITSLFKASDSAMYEAKKTNVSHFCFC